MLLAVSRMPISWAGYAVLVVVAIVVFAVGNQLYERWREAANKAAAHRARTQKTS
jgi:hypothetical protein